MKKIYKYNTFNFLKESYSDFNQFTQGAISPHSLGPGYGFAVDPSLSIYGNQDSPYVDPYTRTPMFVSALQDVIKNLNKNTFDIYGDIKYDQFLEDISLYSDLTILRINKNENITIDIYISFKFDNIEYFGVFKKFNWIERDTLKTDLFTDSEYKYIDKTYQLKLDNYLYQLLINWFKPKQTKYILLKDKLIVKNNMGKQYTLLKNNIIDIIYTSTDKDNNSFIKFTYENNEYVITKNDYYFFNYWFDEYNI